MFGIVICQVDLLPLPIDSELSLFDSIADPVKPHVHGFRSLDFCPAVGKAISCGIVHGDTCQRDLWAAQFQEELSYVCYLLPVVEEGANFCF